MKLVRKPLKNWTPPFCPHRNCLHHNRSAPDWRYKKAGFFRTLSSPIRIQRFTCKTCRGSFSTQTFSTTYWQKRPDLDAKLLTKTIGGMANRQAARDLKVNPGTVDRHIARLARHCMLYHLAMMQTAPPITEVVVDGSLLAYERVMDAATRADSVQIRRLVKRRVTVEIPLIERSTDPARYSGPNRDLKIRINFY